MPKQHMSLPVTAATCFLLVSLVMLLVYRLFARSPRRPAPLKTMAVLGSGGHTTEMQRLLSSLHGSGDKYSRMVLVVAADDALSRQKASTWYTCHEQPQIESIRRSRAVGQSYASSVWTTILALADALLVVIRTDPDLVICNGPGTCVPVCIAAKIYSRSTIVFVESFCRVHSLSLSGRILYFIADHFLVQWPSLVVKYPKTHYCGLLV